VVAPHRTRDDGTCCFVFSEMDETIFARDGTQARGHALNLIPKPISLISCEVLAVRHADEPDGDQIVEILRVPHGGTL
jgi:hypothetical protein